MKRVLVVEDEVAIADLIRDVLIDEGYDVAHATNGQDALARLTEFRPHLILTDVMMPLLDGKALCRAVRDLPDFHNVPLVVMSAVGEWNIRDQCPYNAFLSKPFNIDTLVSTVERCLDENVEVMG